MKGKGKQAGASATPPVRTADDERVLQGVEWGIAILLTGVALFFHYTFFSHVGPLWRDEINSVAFARMPSIASIYENLRYDSFPLLSTMLLRGWIAAFGSADSSLRIYGLLIGSLLVGSLWWTSRLLGKRTPLFSLALVGFNPWVVRTVGSIRPYGLGIALIVATLGCVWKAVETSKPRWFLAATLLAVASVHCMFQNAFLLLAICVAGAVAALRDGEMKTAILTLGVGFVAAVSIAIYLPSLAASQAWAPLVRQLVPMKRLWDTLTATLSFDTPANLWPWIVLAIIALCLGAYGLISKRRRRADRGRAGLAVYGATILVVGTAAYLAALKSTQLQTEPWYYVPLAVLMAPVLDAVVGLLATSERPRILRAAAVLAVSFMMAASGWSQARTRWTNIDIVAQNMSKQVTAGDTIVLNPFWLGMTFQRYYHGPAAWVTLPPIDDVSIVRYDLVKAAMARPRPIDPTLEAMARSLQSGHRIWWVGGISTGPDGETPRILPPAPLPNSGWFIGPYLYSWGRQAAHLVELHGVKAEVMEAHVGGPVSNYENVTVTIVSGWK